nr:MarR family transcriptional regulator [Jiella sp. LLJ827]
MGSGVRKTDRLRLDDQLCFALYAATNAVTRAYRPLLQNLNLTYPQYLVMLTLWQDGTSSSRDISERLKLAPNALTPLLDRLEKAGFIARKRDQSDRRIVHISLTEAGKALESTVADAQYSVACQTRLTDEGLAELREELFALVERMSDKEPVSEEG